MFIMKRPFSRGTSVDLDDAANIKFSMRALNYYDDTKTGLSTYADDDLFTSVKKFQKDNNLTIDGIINPLGETYEKIKEKLSEVKEAGLVYKDFAKNYFDMRQADFIGADKYFHCKANYEASERGAKGHDLAVGLSDARAWYKDNFTDNSNLDIYEDQGANIYGREAAKSGRFQSSRDACARLRPDGLDDKY